MKWQEKVAHIIPISKLLGNYNHFHALFSEYNIIPISKLLGNYNNALRP